MIKNYILVQYQLRRQHFKQNCFLRYGNVYILYILYSLSLIGQGINNPGLCIPKSNLFILILICIIYKIFIINFKCSRFHQSLKLPINFKSMIRQTWRIIITCTHYKVLSFCDEDIWFFGSERDEIRSISYNGCVFKYFNAKEKFFNFFISCD